jgi:mycothiol system anti-sigma-R factor
VSCGQPHDTNCSEVLADVWMFLDNECDGERRRVLQRHLDECGHCLEEFGLEEHLKALLARKCGGDAAPHGLRQRLRQSIREIVVQQAEVSVHSTEVTVERSSDGTVIEVRSSTEVRQQR